MRPALPGGETGSHDLVINTRRHLDDSHRLMRRVRDKNVRHTRMCLARTELRISQSLTRLLEIAHRLT